MNRLLAALVLILSIGFAACQSRPAAGEVIHRDDFTAGLSQWVPEQMPGGTARTENGVLMISDNGGGTVWFREKLTAPVVITFESTFIDAGGPNDRVSDMNCFWMASDPRSPGNLFAPGHGRTGAFATYDTLQTYYVGYGGNTNTTTRFRRYDGSGARPLLPEHERTTPEYLLAPGQPYRITLEAHLDGTVRYWRNGQLIFEWKDPEPLTEGWFGFRTVKSHQHIRDFRVMRPSS